MSGENCGLSHVHVDPLTLTLSPSEGERETIAGVCQQFHGFISRAKFAKRMANFVEHALSIAAIVFSKHESSFRQKMRQAVCT